MQLVSIKEAAARVGKHETTLYGHARRGDFELVHKEVDGRERSFIRESDLKRLYGSESNGHETGVSAEAEAEIDPFEVALGRLVSAANDLRRAVKAHDRRVRREAVTEFVEAMREGLK